MRFVGDQSRATSDAGVQQRFRYPGATLVGAYQNLDTLTEDTLLAHPFSYFVGDQWSPLPFTSDSLTLLLSTVGSSVALRLPSFFGS